MTARDSAPATSRRPFAALIAAMAIAMSIFFTLYSLIPVIRPEAPALSSLFVGTMMAAVMCTQALAPTLVRCFSLRTVIAATTLLIGIGACVTGFASTVPLLLAGAVLGGASFGAGIVAGAQGVALLVRPATLSRSLGIYGLITMSVSAVGSPLGVHAAVTWSPQLLGVAALAVAIVGAGVAWGIPGSVGRDAQRDPAREQGGTARAESPGSGPDSGSPRDVSVPRTTPAGGYRNTPVLVLALLLSAVIVLSHGLLSFPQVAAPANAALLILFVQAGNAIGRWVGGELDTRAGAATALLSGTGLLVLGSVAGVFVGQLGVAAALGLLLGLGVGIVQTATLHATMQRMDAGTASVVWNLSVDAGLWLGGIVWGLALSGGHVHVGVMIISALALVIGIILAGTLRRR